MNILSIQSWVCYGHVGNAIAVFPLQRLGAEVWAVNTVQFSNHTGYGAWTGRVTPAGEITALLDGMEARGVLGRCDAVLSGYVGEAATGAAIVDAVERVRRLNPAALYCCDPVIGDAGVGAYVRPGVAEFLGARALPCADIATPNQFELRYLTGHACTSLAETISAVQALRAGLCAGGLRNVLVTSLRSDATPADSVDVLAADEHGCFLVRTPLLGIEASGAGDAMAALYLFHRLSGADARHSLEAAVSSVFGLLRRTVEAGSSELLMVAAQEEFVRPSRWFSALPC